MSQIESLFQPPSTSSSPSFGHLSYGVNFPNTSNTQPYQHPQSLLNTQHRPTSVSSGLLTGSFATPGIAYGPDGQPRQLRAGQGHAPPFSLAQVSTPTAQGTGPTLSPTSAAPQRLRDQALSASPKKHPMAAPPLPSSVQQTQSPPPTPDVALERERVALLLDINASLIQELGEMQSQGRGGALNAQVAAMNRSQGILPDNVAAEDFIQTMLRFQANLAYLFNQPDMQAPSSAQAKKPPAHPPHFMRPPPHMQGLDEKYARLRQLFPGWVSRDTPTAVNQGAQA